MKLALLGPVGSGKSTQAQRVSQLLVNYTRISTGFMVRNQIKAGTELGEELKGYYDKGEQIPDDLILRLTIPRLQPAGFWILDGFPRTVAQARALDEELEGRGGGMNRVIVLEGPDEEELVSRVTSGRVQSRATGMVYHLEHNPPPDPSEHKDPGPFEPRDDDTEDTLRQQIKAYNDEASELKEHYERQGLLSAIDAGQPVEKVTENILEALGHPENPNSEVG